MFKNRPMLMGVIVTVLGLGLGVVAILTAFRLSQAPEQPVAPTVPQEKPQAQAPTAACHLSFAAKPIPTPKCDLLVLSPSSTTLSSPGERRTITASATGGTAPLTFTWASSTTGTGQGTLSATSGKSITWTAPAAGLTDGQSWTIAATVADANNQTDTGNCTVTLTYQAAPQALKCNGVSMSPESTVITGSGESRSLSVTSSGGYAPVSFSWLVTGNATDAGTLSSGTGNNVVWTSPASLGNTAENWTVTATAKDSHGNVDSTNCSVNLAYSPVAIATHKTCQNNACMTVSGAGSDSCTSDTDCQTTTPPPPPPPGTPTHKACQNNACITVSGSGSDSCLSDTDCQTVVAASHRECQNNACVVVSGAGTDSCTSDVSCRPAATPPSIPVSGNSTLSIGAIVLGVITLGAGLLFVF